MISDFTSKLCDISDVIVRVGLNLQPGQPLLITEPYELQGVHPETNALVAAIRTAVSKLEVESAGSHSTIEVIQSDPDRLRELVETDNTRGYEILVSNHSRRMQQHLARGGAFLFLMGSQPQLMSGLPAERLARFDRIKWRHLGPVIQPLVRGASQWTLAPSPSSVWANAVGMSVDALWEVVFQAMRVTRSHDSGASGQNAHPASNSVERWYTHLSNLARRRDELNNARYRHIRYVGDGTDLTLDLPRSHAWCTAQLISKAGVPFVVNLPTEEIFTAPHKKSARGIVRIARPVTHGGSVIEGIELEFRRGRVVSARSSTGQEALQHLLATDHSSDRIGEVAILPALLENKSPTAHSPSRDGSSTWQASARLFHHTLLDENAANHIALGDAYPFCSRAFMPLALNSSQIHLDLPLDASVEFS